MIKISIIEPIGAHGGNDIYDFNLLSSIDTSKSKAVLYTCDKTEKKENVKLVYKKVFGNYNKFFRAIRYIKGTIASLQDSKQNKSDVVHLHFFGFTFLEYINLLLSKVLFGFKTVATVHDVESFEEYAKNSHSKKNYNKFFKLLDGIIVHTEYAKDELSKYIDNDFYVSNFINTIYAGDLDYSSLENNSIDKKIARNKLNLPSDREVILFFGQIKKVKGLDILLKALAYIKTQKPNVLLVVAGKIWKDEFNIYQDLITEYNLEQNIDLRIGFIKTEDVKYYFSATDLIVLPYRKIYNSGVLIRAMSFATPVVASDFGPFKEFILDSQNGYLFENENERSLSQKIIFALDDVNSLKIIGLNAKKVIYRDFELKKLGMQYIEFYNKVIKG